MADVLASSHPGTHGSCLEFNVGSGMSMPSRNEFMGYLGSCRGRCLCLDAMFG